MRLPQLLCKKSHPSHIWNTLKLATASSAPPENWPSFNSNIAGCVVVSYPLCSIINSSTARSLFPTPWKCAIVKPLHKGGHHASPTNYHPISLLSVPSKGFEGGVEGSPYWLLVGSLGLSTLASRRKSHLALTMFNCMSSKSPLYLSQLFPLPSSHYNTCSALSSQLNLPPNRSSFGQKSFSFMGTALWQSLPPNIRDTKEFNSFYSLCQQHFSTNI